MPHRPNLLFSWIVPFLFLPINSQATDQLCEEARAGNKQAIQQLIAVAESLQSQREFTPDKILVPACLDGIKDPLIVQWKARQNEPIWILIHFDESLIRESLTSAQISQLYSTKNIQPFLNTGFGQTQTSLSEDLEEKLERIKKNLI
jgi:hypothetical protein